MFDSLRYWSYQLKYPFKEWVSFFLCSWGMNRSAGQTNRVNREAVLGRFVCSALRFIPHEHRKRDTHSLYLQCFQPRTLSKIFREKLWIQNSYSNGLLTSFDALITAHVIRSNCRTFCWLCSSGNELKIFSRVQRRKYVTIVNISDCIEIEWASLWYNFKKLSDRQDQYLVFSGCLLFEIPRGIRSSFA